MRRTLFLLALLAGSWGGGDHGPITADSATHELSASPFVTPAAFVRSAPALVVVAPEHGSGPAPRATAGRSCGQGLNASFPPHAAARDALVRACRAEHRQFATPHALARAGLLSSPPTAPPSFQII